MSSPKLDRWMDDYPSVSDLTAVAQRRIPNVAWEYMETGTGDETALRRNRDAFSELTLLPRVFQGPLEPKLETTLFGQTYAAPFGIAPIGLTGLMWPRAEQMLAATAARHRVPFCLSTVATQTPETVGPLVQDMGWFQLYPPRDPKIRKELLKRAQDSGFHTLLLTADVPTPSRRERTRRAGLVVPPRMSAKLVWDGLTHPRWMAATLRAGFPRLRTIEPYLEQTEGKGLFFLKDRFGGSLTWDYVKATRDEWDGPFVLKGILRPEDLETAIGIGVDGIIVSNHGGRQFDAAPATLDLLPQLVAAAAGRVAVMLDSGIRSGMDAIKALCLGADFVLVGRGFLYGVAGLGKYGGDHVCAILREEMTTDMIQLGCQDVASIRQLEPYGGTGGRRGDGHRENAGRAGIRVAGDG